MESATGVERDDAAKAKRITDKWVCWLKELGEGYTPFEDIDRTLWDSLDANIADALRAERDAERERCLLEVQYFRAQYPTDIFIPVTQEDTAPIGTLSDRIAAQMGRHAADTIEAAILATGEKGEK